MAKQVDNYWFLGSRVGVHVGNRFDIVLDDREGTGKGFEASVLRDFCFAVEIPRSDTDSP